MTSTSRRSADGPRVTASDAPSLVDSPDVATPATSGVARASRDDRAPRTSTEEFVLRGATLPRTARLRERADYLGVSAGGRKAHTPHFVVLWLERRQTSGDPERTLDSPTRLGITVTRKIGNAVRRNRIKRWVREAFRRHRDELPRGVDLVVIAKQGADTLGFAGVVSELLGVRWSSRSGARHMRGRGPT